MDFMRESGGGGSTSALPIVRSSSPSATPPLSAASNSPDGSKHQGAMMYELQKQQHPAEDARVRAWRERSGSLAKRASSPLTYENLVHIATISTDPEILGNLEPHPELSNLNLKNNEYNDATITKT
jgi:hypothetical protein